MCGIIVVPPPATGGVLLTFASSQTMDPNQAMPTEDPPSDIPDYLEILKAERKREKQVDELLAQGELPPELAEAEARMERKRRKKLMRQNTGVYVTGLPVDTDPEELADFMTR